MILIGLGGNLACPKFGPPRATCGAALQLLEARGLGIERRSRWFESAPVPAADQPWYVNGVVAVKTELSPQALVGDVLHVEAEMGRRRSVPNAPRTIDIDVLAYGREITRDGPVTIPHPRMHERAFVLLPLAEIVPDWTHPVNGEPLADLIAALPNGQICRPMDDADGRFGTEWRG